MQDSKEIERPPGTRRGTSVKTNEDVGPKTSGVSVDIGVRVMLSVTRRKLPDIMYVCEREESGLTQRTPISMGQNLQHIQPKNTASFPGQICRGRTVSLIPCLVWDWDYLNTLYFCVMDSWSIFHTLLHTRCAMYIYTGVQHIHCTFHLLRLRSNTTSCVGYIHSSTVAWLYMVCAWMHAYKYMLSSSARDFTSKASREKRQRMQYTRNMFH